MKLIDILVEELKEWPAKADRAWQSITDTEIYFVDSTGGLVDSLQTKDFARVRGESGSVTKEQWEATQTSTVKIQLHRCPTCSYPYKREYNARHCCDLQISVCYICSHCRTLHTEEYKADICCRSSSKIAKVDVKTVLYAAFDLLSSHREMSENEYTISGSNRLDDIGGMLQDFIEQNEITGF